MDVPVGKIESASLVVIHDRCVSVCLGVMYGRDDATWSQLTEAGQAFLIERARLRRTTSYTELNTTLERRTGLPGFDFTHADERAAMGHLLYLIVMRDWPQTRLMLSALVLYLNGNDPGTGFYALAQELEMLPARASAEKRKSSGSAISGTCTSTIPAPVDKHHDLRSRAHSRGRQRAD